MKKILFYFSLLLMVTSCSTDEPSTGVQTTDVVFALKQPSTETGKGIQVQRGDIPAGVNRIDIVANLNGGNYSTDDFYNLVPNTQTSATKNFTLNDVGIGNNTFIASSTTDSAKKYVLAPTSGTPVSVITGLKNNNPYVLYNGTVTQNISATGTNIVNINMTTQHGRILSVFQLEDNQNFKNGYEASITAKVDGEPSAGTTKVQKEGLVYFEWSNDKALAGKKVVYTIDVTPINNNNNLHTIYTLEQTIKASTSISCLYTITKDKAPSPYTSENKIFFSFQKWVEESCEGCNF